MRHIDKWLSEGITAVTLASTGEVLAVVIAKVPAEMVWPEAHSHVERGAFDGAVSSCPGPAARVEARQAVGTSHRDEVALLVFLEHRLALQQRPAVVAFHPEPGRY